MSRETQTREIDGVTYVVEQLGAKAGLRVLARLTKILGPVAVGAEGAGMLGAIVEAVQRLDPADLVVLVEELEPTTKIERPIQSSGAKSITVPLDADSHFAGKIGAMLSWIAFVLEVNFADFFGEIVSKVTAATDAIRSAKGSPSPSTSASGGPSSE